MRARSWSLGLMVFFGSALSASAQYSNISPTNTTGTSAPGFFTNPFAKPDFSQASVKPTVAGPNNLVSMMPSWSFLQSSIMGRSVPSTVTMTMPRTQATPPTATSPTTGTGRNWLGFGGAGRGPNSGPGFGQHPHGFGQNQGGFGQGFGGYGARQYFPGFFP